MGDRIHVDYFTDVLCIWAYAAQIRVDELRSSFPDEVLVQPRIVQVFSDTSAKLENWKNRGGAEGYNRHVLEIAERFPHITVHPEIWTRDVPAGSYSPHAYIKAAELAADDGAFDDSPRDGFAGRSCTEELAWRLRLAFFRDLDDIAQRDVQASVAKELELPVDALQRQLDNGRALAALAADHDTTSRHQVSGSPTYLLNEGRQKLYGNVGYRVIEANVRELLDDGRECASWC